MLLEDSTIVALIAKVIKACDICDFVIGVSDEIGRFLDSPPCDKVGKRASDLFFEDTAQIIRMHKRVFRNIGQTQFLRQVVVDILQRGKDRSRIFCRGLILCQLDELF